MNSSAVASRIRILVGPASVCAAMAGYSTARAIYLVALTRRFSPKGEPMMADKIALLRYCACFYALGLALHTADHLRRGFDVVTPQVIWAGNVSTAIGVIVVALVLLGHRRAPLLAAVTGIPIAFGVA